MGLLSRIFGSDKNNESIVSGAISGLDKIVFTKEERSDANAKVSEWYLKYLAATQPQNLARRLIALVIVLLWAALVLSGIGAYVVEVTWLRGEPALSLFIFKVLNELVHQPFMLIMGFYFLAHVVRTYQNGSKKG